MEKGISTFEGVRGYVRDGVAYISLEQAAVGLGFTTTAKKEYEILATSGKKNYKHEAVRWNRVEKYLRDIFSTTSSENISARTEADRRMMEKTNYRPEFISESVFFLLAMKAKNDAAIAFQMWVAYEVLPSIRKYGYYKVPKPVLEKKPVGRPPLALAGYVERQQKYIFANGEKCDITDLRWICRELGMPLDEICDKRTSRMVEFVNEQMTACGIASITDIPKRGYEVEYDPDEMYTVYIDGEAIELVR